MDHKESPFQPGIVAAKVHRDSFSAYASFKKVTIAKVYKNGNFVLVGSPQQYRPSRHWDKWVGVQVNGYSGDRIEILTDELREEAAQSERRREFSEIVKSLGAWRGPVSEYQLAQARALNSNLSEKP
jgi:hypothetical protein